MSDRDLYYDPPAPPQDIAVQALRARALAEPLELTPPSRRPRWVVRGLVAAVLLLFVLVVGLAWSSFTGSDLTGEPALVRADAEPYKVPPAEPGSVLPGESAAGAAISGIALPEDRIDGEGGAGTLPGARERTDLAAGDPAPLDAATPPTGLERVPIEEAPAAMADAAPDLADRSAAEPLDPDAIVADPLEPPAGVAESDRSPPLAQAPGSLASPAEPLGPAQAAGGEPPAPADAPEAPLTGPEPPVEVAAALPAPPEPEISPEPPEQVVAAAEVARGPLPSPRKPRRTQAAAIEPQAGPAPVAAAAPAGGGVWRVQVASLRDDAAARRAWDTVRARHGEVLSGVTATIVRAEISSGTVYRVQVGPFPSRPAADAACRALKARGADCLTVGPTR